LFFVHLALETILKAHVCRATRDVPPRLHLLLRLAERPAIGFSEGQQEFFARFDRHHLEGRYPDSAPLPLDPNAAQREMAQGLEILQWLIQQL
jgi:HEPN domain-containing protein